MSQGYEKKLISPKNVEKWENYLIVHDFDGCIADDEFLWWGAWKQTLEDLRGIKLNEEQVERLILGVADKVRKERLEKEFPSLKIDAEFLKEVNSRIIYAAQHFITPMPGVMEVLNDKKFAHCIATGATLEQHSAKMPSVPEIEAIIPRNCWFAADMVENSKPAPDLFWLSAEKMGYPLDKCISIGDTVNDCLAAQAAGIKFFAFLGAKGNDTPERKQKFAALGVRPEEMAVNWPELHQKMITWANL